MPAKPSRKLTVILQDAKALIQRVEKNVKAFASQDKDRKLKTPALVAQLKKLVADATGATRVQSATIGSAKSATRNEQKLRKALSAALLAVRDDVRDGVEEEDVRRAFGVGRDLESSSTTVLVEIADDVLGAWETHADAVKAAGVTKKKIDAVEKARAALSEADAAQGTAKGAQVKATAGKRDVVGQLMKLVSRLRERARTTERGKKTSTYKSTAPRRRSRTRVKKGAAAPTTAPAETKAG